MKKVLFTLLHLMTSTNERTKNNRPVGNGTMKQPTVVKILEAAIESNRTGKAIKL